MNVSTKLAGCGGDCGCAPCSKNAQMAGFREDAEAALAASPNYFLTWYTVKSIGLVVFSCWLAYQLGRMKEKS